MTEDRGLSEPHAISKRLELQERILECRACPLHKAGRGPVPFSGPTPARWAVLGEAPEADEDRLGRLFVGESGLLLRRLLRAAGLDVSKAFLCNTASCWPNRPSPNRAPFRSEVKACAQNRTDQLEMSGARFVLALGTVPLQSFYPEFSIVQARGHPFMSGNQVVMATYHPTAALRRKEWEDVMAGDIANFAAMVATAGDENPLAWHHYWAGRCIMCQRTDEQMGMLNQGIHFALLTGLAYCEECWDKRNIEMVYEVFPGTTRVTVDWFREDSPLPCPQAPDLGPHEALPPAGYVGEWPAEVEDS